MTNIIGQLASEDDPRDVGEREAATERLVDELREDVERYRLIVDSARDYAILTTDPEGRIESWSAGAAAVYGWTAAEVIGEHLAMTFLPEDRAQGAPEDELRVALQAGVAPDVRWHLRKDGRRVFIDGNTRPIRDNTGALRGFLKVGQDITRRRDLDEALRASESRYRTLVEHLTDYAIYLLDERGRITEWTTGAQHVKGYGADDVLGRHFSMFFTEEDILAGEPERELDEAAATGRAERIGWRVRQGGERFWANEIATAVRNAEGELVGFTKITRDLTEQRLASEAELRTRSESEREAWRRQLAAAEEDERRRISRDLHDQLGQHLTAFGLVLAETRQLVPEDSEAWKRMAQLQELAQVMTRDARYLALELRPPELDDVGLESALASYVDQWRTRFGIAAELAVTGDADSRTLPVEVGTALYRIAQEALTNIVRHAEATQVSVQLDEADGAVRLVIEDDGRGFDFEETRHRVRREHRLGLASMRERATLVGGTFEIESTPGEGTTVFVRVPLERG